MQPCFITWSSGVQWSKLHPWIHDHSWLGNHRKIYCYFYKEMNREMSVDLNYYLRKKFRIKINTSGRMIIGSKIWERVLRPSDGFLPYGDPCNLLAAFILQSREYSYTEGNSPLSYAMMDGSWNGQWSEWDLLLRSAVGQTKASSSITFPRQPTILGVP